MMPFSCAASSASQICFAIASDFIDWNRAALDPLRQRFSPDEFHHEELAFAGFFQSVNRCDVGMIQRRQHARFTLESRSTFGIVR